MMTFLASCHNAVDDYTEPQQVTAQPTVAPELEAIDSLMWQLPDTAFVRLLAYLDDTLCKADCDRHFAHVLLAELLYKNYYPQENREELLQAVDYFDSVMAGMRWADTRGADARVVSLQRDIFIAARAHYINGIGHYETDSIMDACKEYMKAMEIMEEWFDGKDLTGNKARFMALAYTHLTRSFSDQYLHEQSIYFGKKALEYYNKYDATAWHKAWILNEIGSHYDIMEKYDSAYFYYCNGLAVLEDTSNLTYRDIATRMALLSYNKNREAKAPLNQLYQLLAQSESEKEYCGRCLTIGGILYHEKEFDSSWVYLQEVFCKSTSVGAKKQAAEWLMDICKAQGRTEESSEYASFLAPFATQSENQSHLMSQLTELYHTYGQNRLKTEHRKQMRKFSKYGGMVLVALVMLAVVSIVLYIVHKKRQRHLETQNEEKDRQLESDRHAHKMKQAALAGRLRRSNETLLETGEKLKAVESELKKLHRKIASEESQKSIEQYRKEDVCVTILKTAHEINPKDYQKLKTDLNLKEYERFALTSQQKAQLLKSAENCFPNLHDSLKDLYPSMKGKDWLYCCLNLLQLDKMTICILLQDSYQSCRRRINNLEEKLHAEEGLQTLLLKIVID